VGLAAGAAECGARLVGWHRFETRSCCISMANTLSVSRCCSSDPRHTKRGLFAHPPRPSALVTTGLERLRDLLAIEASGGAARRFSHGRLCTGHKCGGGPFSAEKRSQPPAARAALPCAAGAGAAERGFLRPPPADVPALRGASPRVRRGKGCRQCLRCAGRRAQTGRHVLLVAWLSWVAARRRRRRLLGSWRRSMPAW
jgi:hypothetical protein